VFEDPEEPCVACVKKGVACEDKWRRAGSQDTVRISVLEVLAQEHPRWTLKDVLAHLKGISAVTLKRERSSSLEGSVVSKAHTLPDELMQYVHFVKVESEPLSMELSLPGMVLN